jgi:hypothetical protein
MLAFHNDQKVKEKYVSRVLMHQKADAIIQGTGWDKGKQRGCAVGCTLENYDHSQYPIELGIPEWMAHLEDALFEGMEAESAKKWPLRFLESINVGANLEKVKTPYFIYILEENLKKLESLRVDPEFKGVVTAIELTKEATVEMIRCHREGRDLWAAESAAWAVAVAAESAAAYGKYADKLLDLLRECDV